MSGDAELERFAQLVVDNLRKQGFPERKVAFPIDRLYESAHHKGVNFNQVLERLAAQGIAHEKTPEKVIFSAAEAHVLEPAPGGAGLPTPFAGLDPSVLQNMSPEQMMAMVQQLMQELGPEQLQAIQAMVGTMSDAERAQMMEQAKKLGLVPG